MIYKDIIDTIGNIFSRFEGVNYVKYQGDDLNNQQHNYKTIQVYIDTYTFHQFNVTQNQAKMEMQIYILKHPTKEPDSILDCQDECYNCALNVLAYIDNFDDDIKRYISVYDYSIITIDRYTAQENAGVKLSLVLTIPNGVDMCDVENWFGEPYTPEPDKEIDVDEKTITEELKINKIKLPKTNVC